MAIAQAQSVPLVQTGTKTQIYDQLSRPLQDLRISVTDRCNFRCTYCMPKEVFGKDHVFLEKQEILSFDEILRLARIFVSLGVRKLRITGGEPLLRPDLPKLIEKLAEISGVEDIALTTNGVALSKLATNLKRAGLKRITVSLDALNPDIFHKMTDSSGSLRLVLDGIQASVDAGFSPIKINAVIKRGVNESEILPLARQFAKPGFTLRFIEYMDVGNSNEWRLNEVVPAAEILEILQREGSLDQLPAQYFGETAKRYKFASHSGEIGIIASVSAPFCGDCTRARISANGRLHTCLFSNAGLDLRTLLRDGSDDRTLTSAISGKWSQRSDRYSEIRSMLSLPQPKPEMSVLGG